jgi:lipoprotein-anchoring transpeptidase ErfK/SrfK
VKNRRLIFILGAVVAAVILVTFLVLQEPSGEVSGARIAGTPSVGSQLKEARGLEGKGDLSGARHAYRSLIEDFPASGDIAQWQQRVSDLNVRILFSPDIVDASNSYKIKSGDTLEKIAKKFNTTVELLKKSNGLPDDKIYADQEIKVWSAPFNVLVDKSQNILILKTNEEVFKTYTVATGKDNSTPVGTFSIVEKIIDPTWFKAGAVIPPGSPDNVLGTRWLGFDLAGYGIHGTTEPESLGKQVTEGCVRLSNADVEELYTIIPKGTQVIVVD